MGSKVKNESPVSVTSLYTHTVAGDLTHCWLLIDSASTIRCGGPPKKTCASGRPLGPREHLADKADTEVESRRGLVTIAARSMQPTGDVFGVAFLDENGEGKYADVFFDNINTLHRDTGANLGRLLGAVAAHEIGHLGFKSHSMWGIMSAHWQQDHLRSLERGALLFTPEQALHMQARIN
jgi:hypothetical protein